MALPFILGVAVGAGAIVAYNKSKKIQETTNDIIEKSKDLASDVKKNIDASVDCIKDKIDNKEKTVKVDEEKSGDI